MDLDKVIEYVIYENLLENCEPIDEGFLKDNFMELKNDLSDMLNMPKNLFNKIKREVKDVIDAPKNFINQVKNNVDSAKETIKNAIDKVKLKIDLSKEDNKKIVKSEIYNEFDFKKMPSKYIKDFDSFIDDYLDS